MPIFHFLKAQVQGKDNDSAEEAVEEKLKVIIQMSRMLRIIRLIRLVKIVPPLYILARGIMDAMQGMFWVLLMLLMFVYMLAILGTRLIGHHLVIPEGASEDALEIADMFSTVGGSMFVIFEMMSYWSLMKFSPLFDAFPATRFFAIGFYITAAWVMLAVMTGVVSEKMLAVREHLTTMDTLMAEMKIKRATELMQDFFERADTDNSRTIDQDEFKAMLANPETDTILRTYTDISKKDLEDLFTWMDRNKDGLLTIDVFMWSFKWLNEEFGQKSFLKMNQLLTSHLKSVEKRLVTIVDERMERFLAAVEDPIRKILVITSQIQRLDVVLCGQAGRLKELCTGRITQGQLQLMEERLHGKIDMLEEAVERLDVLEAKGLLGLEEPAIARSRSAKFMVGLRSSRSVKSLIPDSRPLVLKTPSMSC